MNELKNESMKGSTNESMKGLSNASSDAFTSVLSRAYIAAHPLPEGIEMGDPAPLPIKVLQFGEGAFLRAFADYLLDVLNEKGFFQGGVAVVQPIPTGNIDVLAAQDGLYTLVARGNDSRAKAALAPVVHTRMISCIQSCINPYTAYEQYIAQAANPQLRYVISNTTEAGIAYGAGDKLTDTPQASFPGKVTAFLYARYRHFAGADDKGLVFLPCELIDHNGTLLKELVLRYAAEWGLESDFIAWVTRANVFADTLVDRITTGYPAHEADALTERLGLGCRDQGLDTCELFYLWVIAAPAWLAAELPFDKAGLNVIFTDDVTPYKLRKVRLLNGAHTSMAPAALLCGVETVGQAVNDPIFGPYLERALFSEIIPSLDMDKSEAEEFAQAVLTRFANPFIEHRLQSITLNSVAKFTVRVLPSLLAYQQKIGVLPQMLTFSFAALLMFYQTAQAVDSAENLRTLRGESENKSTLLDRLPALLADTGLWGQDLSGNAALVAALTETLRRMHEEDIRDILAELLAAGRH